MKVAGGMILAAIILAVAGAQSVPVQTGKTASVISGRIVSMNGKPAADIRVAALEAGDGSNQVDPLLVSFTQTDAEGRYRLEDVPPGNYYIVAGLVSDPTYFPGIADRLQARSITVNAGARLESVDFPFVTSLTPTPQPPCSNATDVAKNDNKMVLAADRLGNVYFAEQYSSWVRKLSPDGTVSTVAGNDTIGTGGDGGPATSASLNGVTLLSADAFGNLYIVEGAVQTRVPPPPSPGGKFVSASPRIRKVTPAGLITTIAGNGVMGFTGDGGPAVKASLCPPTGLGVDGQGNLFIASDPGFGSNRDFTVRKVDAAGVITTVPGATIRRPLSMADILPGFFRMNFAVDVSGNIFVAGPDEIIKVTADGAKSRVTDFERTEVSGASIDGAGNLLLADSRRNVVVRMTNDGTFTIVAGNGSAGMGSDGGSAIASPLALAKLVSRTDGSSIAVDGAGSIFIAEGGFADTVNNRDPVRRIRKVNPDGVISTALTLTNSRISGRLTSTVPHSSYAQIGFEGTVGAVPPIATLYLVRRDMDGPSTVASARPSMETPDNGRFEIENILPGIYDLFATLPDIHGGDSISLPGAPKVAFGRAIINARENVSGATINIHPGVDLNGRVTIDGRPAAPSGLMVHLQPDAQAAKLTHYQNVSRYRPVIGVDGTFRFPVLPEAQYGIAVDGFEDSSLTLADILLDGKSVKLSGVSIGATPPGLLEIVLKRSGNGQ